MVPLDPLGAGVTSALYLAESRSASKSSEAIEAARSRLFFPLVDDSICLLSFERFEPGGAI